MLWFTEVESSRTHFEVLGLGLEASSRRKLACPRLEDSSSFWIVKILWNAWKIFWKTFFCGDRLKNFCEDLFFLRSPEKFCEDLFFFRRALALVSLVLGLEHSWPWPPECLSWERLSLASLILTSSLILMSPWIISNFAITDWGWYILVLEIVPVLMTYCQTIQNKARGFFFFHSNCPL